MAKGFNDLSTGVQALILFLVAVIAAGAVFYYFVWPISVKRDNLDRDVKNLKQENDRNEAFRREQTEYQNRISQLKTQLETLRSIVPEEQATDQFMRMIFEGGRSTGVNIRTFIAQPEVQHELYREMPFSLRMDGTYYAMVNFFNQLAHQQRIVSVNISNISFGPPAGGGRGAYTVSSSETVGANCVVTTYYNPPPAGTAPPAKKK